MTVENYDMRLQFLNDIEVTDWTFTDTSAGTTATITALLRKEYLEVKVEGVVGVQNNAQFAFIRTSDVPSIKQGRHACYKWGNLHRCGGDASWGGNDWDFRLGT